MTSPSPHPARKRLLLAASGVFLMAAAGAGLWGWLAGARVVQTDDAYVHGNLVQITPQVAGTVIAIDADDTDTVAAGQAVVRLDASDADVAQALAQARLAQTVRQVATLYVQNDSLAADVAVRAADIARAQSELRRSQSDVDRRRALSAMGGVSSEEFLHAESALHAAQAGLAQARAAHAAARARLATNQALTHGASVADHPDVRAAAENVRAAWLARSRTQIPAPVAGMVARRRVQLGQRVAPGAVLMDVVPLDTVWVQANFKENQLRHMRVGQEATLTADLYGSSVTYHGTVVGLDAGTGSAFALLPAQNATGNWIKVVQRVPVRIALDADELRAHPLRVGLSMTVKVDVESDAKSDAQSGDGAPAPAAPIAPRGWSTAVFAPAHEEIDALIDRIIRANLRDNPTAGSQ